MRRILLLAGLSVAVIGVALLAQPHRPEPVGPITQRWECVYTSDRDSYQRVIVYRDRHGDVMGHSAGAGRCRP